MQVNIVDADDVKPRRGKAPVTRMIEGLPAGYLTARDVAEHFKVNIETIRRLARAKNTDGSNRFKAPSKAAKSGELLLWVYTPADMEELTQYFNGRTKRGRKSAR